MQSEEVSFQSAMQSWNMETRASEGTERQIKMYTSS